MSEGKQEFYKKAETSLRNSGYTVYGERDISGIGPSHSSKPDYIAFKDGTIIIGEIKSPKEIPSSSSWRQIQNSDGPEFKLVRLEISNREDQGSLSKDIGGHLIIIRGQLPDYVRKLGKTYTLPPLVSNCNSIAIGYSFPPEQIFNVDAALINLGKRPLKSIIGTEVITYIIESEEGIMAGKIGKGGWIGPTISLASALITAVASVISSRPSQKKDTLRSKLKDLEISRKKYGMSDDVYENKKKEIIDSHNYENVK